jgi:hypothetical protein
MLVRAQDRPVGANSRINVGVIGVGGRGAWLLKLVHDRMVATGDVQIVAVCDVYQKRLNEAVQAAGSNPKPYVYHQELLDHRGLDAVFIATPDHWHAPITLAALAKGIDVYCEKPMTHTLEEATQVTRAAAKGNRILQIPACSALWFHAMALIAGTSLRAIGTGRSTLRQALKPAAKGISIGSSGSVPRLHGRTTRIASSGFASTGITRAESPPTSTITPWRRFICA